MTKSIFKNIKVIALDIDGVLLKDTFSPVMRKLVNAQGHEYSAEIERNVFSQKREHATGYINKKLGLGKSHEEILNMYFAARKEYIAENGAGFVDGLEEFLTMLKRTGVELLCYGGLDYAYFEKEMESFTHFFSGEKYICTNDFRPGVKEIVAQLGLKPSEVLFIDDVNLVAEAAKNIGAPFIGVPSVETWGYQKQDMEETGVKFMVSGVNEISLPYLQDVDNAVAQSKHWI